MFYSSPKQLCLPPVTGHTLRADFEGGAVSSDFGPLLLRGVDRQIGLTERLAAAIHAKRHVSYIDHPLRDLLAQRLYHIAAGYPDGNDANSLRHDPVVTLGDRASTLGYNAGLSQCPDFLTARTQCGPQGRLSSHHGLGGPVHCQLGRAPRCHRARPRSLR
jgi:Transposase DDE domain group 1